MAQVLINATDLRALVRKCIELEVSDRSYRACVSHMARKMSQTTNFPQQFGAAYRKELECQKEMVTPRYASLLQAIADGVQVDDALKNLAETL